MNGMRRSRSASAIASLPKPATLVPDGIGRSTAAVSVVFARGCRPDAATSRVDIGMLSVGAGWRNERGVIQADHEL